METGARIKYHRIKQQLELSDLAADLLLPAELKKIELGEITPSPEVLKALCEKLKIPLNPIENPIGQELIEQFKEMLLHPQERIRIREHYYFILQHPLLNIDEEVELEYSIQLIRFFVITGDLDGAGEKIQELEKFKEFMNQEQYYLFHKYCGNHNYMIKNFDEALNLYLLAEKIAPSSVLPTECGDLYYSIAISAAQLHKNEVADKYSRMALAIYEEEFVPKRIVECHINLGITQQRLKNFKASLDHLKIALKIGKKLNINNLLYISEFNCSIFYYAHRDFNSSIHHMENCLNYIPDEYIADKLAAYCLLVKCCFEKQDYIGLQKWMKTGNNLVIDNNIDLNSPTNQKFSEAYYEFRCLQNLYEENYTAFEKDALKSLIPVLETDKNFHDLAYYYGHLGNVYLKLGKFKKSAIMLSEAQEALKKFNSFH
ncbi:transcriptional regulator [Planococcus lenghuensis]|uniref:Transcriptional regulator n=2 Tax=Planococcus lenghuensis TaxID=2213202 RepID=A0A1Q2L0I1_9BACL|nr:transcriptional regulator [Planococcus lenghuensis]